MPANPAPRLSARDLLAPTAFFVGALLLAAAIAMGPVVASGFKKVPLDVDATWVADGSDGTKVLDRCSLDRASSRVLEAKVQQRRRVVVVQPSDADRVTLQAGTALGVDDYVVDGKRVDAKDVCAEATLAATVDRVTLDRNTASPSGLPSEVLYDDDKGAVQIDGRRGFTYVFPFGFDEDAPEFFDVTTRQSVPMKRLGEETIGGRETIRYQVQVPFADLSQFDTRAVITRKASWFGSFPGVRPDELLTASLYHSSGRQVFVDAATGTIVDERVGIVEEYRFTPGIASRSAELRDFRLTNVETTLTGDRQSRRDGADAAAAREWPVTLTGVILPIVFAVLGVGALVFGWWAARRRRSSSDA